MTTSEKVARLKGLIEGLGITDDTKEGKAINVIAEILGELALETADLENQLDELNDYVEEIDEDLAAIEDDIYDDECDGDCDGCDGDCLEEEDEDDDIEYYEIECPHCHEIVVLDDSIDPSSIKCPACGEEFNAGE